MHYSVKRLHRDHPDFRANDYDQKRLTEVAQERCGLCWDLWPKSMMKDYDGRHRCPDCWDTVSETAKAEIVEYDADQIAQKQTRPQVSLATMNPANPPHITSMTDANGTAVTQLAPLAVTRTLIGPTKPVTLILTGGDFAATDTFTSGTGITILSALSGTTVWTLTITASVTGAAGYKDLTYNSHTYRGIIRAL